MKKGEGKINKIEKLTVFCASSDGFDVEIYEEAYRLGSFLADRGIELVFGGSKLGLMGQVAKGVLDRNGRVTGIIPEFLKTKEVVHEELTNLITTTDMHQRKLQMQEQGDGFVTLPGGFGTLEEFFEILTWGQLGLHRKPVAILNTNHYYDDLLRMMDHMVEKGMLRIESMSFVLVSDNMEELLDKMERFQPLPVPKWLNKNRT